REPGRGAGFRPRPGQGQPRRILRDPPAAAVPAGKPEAMKDIAWIDAALISARPRAVSALLRYFRNLDSAEEAFQNACLKALDAWPRNGPPRAPAPWLIMVRRNLGIYSAHRQ